MRTSDVRWVYEPSLRDRPPIGQQDGYVRVRVLAPIGGKDPVAPRDVRCFVYTANTLKGGPWNRLARYVNGEIVELLDDNGEAVSLTAESPINDGEWAEFPAEEWAHRVAKLRPSPADCQPADLMACGVGQGEPDYIENLAETCEQPADDAGEWIECGRDEAEWYQWCSPKAKKPIPWSKWFRMQCDWRPIGRHVYRYRRRKRPEQEPCTSCNDTGQEVVDHPVYGPQVTECPDCEGDQPEQDDKEYHVTVETRICPSCGHEVRQQIAALQQNAPYFKYLFCGACEATLKVEKRPEQEPPRNGCKHCGGVIGVDCDGRGYEDCTIRIPPKPPRSELPEWHAWGLNEEASVLGVANRTSEWSGQDLYGKPLRGIRISLSRSGWLSYDEEGVRHLHRMLSGIVAEWDAQLDA